MSRKSTVVLLHAMGSSHAMWDAQVAELFGDFDVLTPDLPGHGLNNKTRFTIDTAAEQVLNAIRSNTSGRVHLVGVSLGGSVAMRVALAAPARVAGMLVSGTMVVPHRRILRAQRIATRILPLSLTAVAAARSVKPARSADRDALIADIVRAGKRTQIDALRALAADDVKQQLRRITVPTLVCRGERDYLIMASSDEMGHQIPNVVERIIPDTDHLWNLQRPDEFTALIREFIAEHPA